MKSPQEIARLRDQLRWAVKLEDQGPFPPEMRLTLAAIWNALAYVLEDGSAHAETFRDNVEALDQWYQEWEAELRRREHVN
jgi:hypothetical protein